jgi:hypothetical protein
MDANAIAKQFGEHYYNCFDTDRSTLSCLYVRLSHRTIPSFRVVLTTHR